MQPDPGRRPAGPHGWAEPARRRKGQRAADAPGRRFRRLLQHAFRRRRGKIRSEGVARASDLRGGGERLARGENPDRPGIQRPRANLQEHRFRGCAGGLRTIGVWAARPEFPQRHRHRIRSLQRNHPLLPRGRLQGRDAGLLGQGWALFDDSRPQDLRREARNPGPGERERREDHRAVRHRHGLLGPFNARREADRHREGRPPTQAGRGVERDRAAAQPDLDRPGGQLQDRRRGDQADRPEGQRDRPHQRRHADRGGLLPVAPHLRREQPTEALPDLQRRSGVQAGGDPGWRPGRRQGGARRRAHRHRHRCRPVRPGS